MRDLGRIPEPIGESISRMMGAVSRSWPIDARCAPDADPPDGGGAQRPAAARSQRRSRAVSGRTALTIALAAALLWSDPAAALQRLPRTYDHGDGLPTDTVSDVVQDADGFIWIATPGGLVRFDGDEMRRWDNRGRAIHILSASRSAGVVAIDTAGGLFRVNQVGGLDPVRGPDGAAVEDARDAQFAPSGALWLVRAAGIARLAPDGAWMRVPSDRFGSNPPWRIRPDATDGALVLTNEAVWSVGVQGRVDRIATVRAAADAVRQPDGSLLILAAEQLVIGQGGVLTPLFTLAARPLDLVLRHRSIWAAYDRFVVRLTPGEAPLVMGPDTGLPAGGPMLVDRESSLWICSFRGLLQFAEPDTVMWSERDGLPSSHARFLGQNAEGLWISTWGGLARLQSTTVGPARVASAPQHLGEVCIDADGGVWHFRDGALAERRHGRTIRHPRFAGGLRFCSPAGTGAVWVGVGPDLVRAGPAGAEPIAGPPTSAPDTPIAPLLEDQRRQVWVWVDSVLCRAPAAKPRREDWVCEPLPDDVTPASMLEVAGSIWLGTDSDGILRRTANGWEQIAASRALGGGRTFKLRPGRQGSVWVLSLGMPTRVIDRPGTPEGWEVVEVLSAWHGQPSGGASDLIEEADGTIWTATAAGLVRVPSHARQVPLAAPAVRLAGLYVDGQSVPVDRPPRLGHSTKLVEMRFAALTFRDRSRLRYQIRLSSDSGWLDLTTGGPEFRFPNPPAGEYVAEVRATIDGRTWSAEGQRLTFIVDGPWYFRPWFVALAMGGVAALLAVLHRARLQLALRLERQRTGIAMDLHDEIGSGLGSIGILAGVATARAADKRDSSVLREIAETASELSAALSDIVWSLRSGQRTVLDLVGHIADRGHRLFPDDAVTFEMHAPDATAADRLSLTVQRSVLLILMEALHNAARHARAHRVEVGVARDGERWRVWVSDDGRGFDAAASGAGVGLTSMRRRAEQIGASLAVHSRPGEGTLVSLSFDPRNGDARRGPHMAMRGPRHRRNLR